MAGISLVYLEVGFQRLHLILSVREDIDTAVQVVDADGSGVVGTLHHAALHVVNGDIVRLCKVECVAYAVSAQCGCTLDAGSNHLVGSQRCFCVFEVCRKHGLGCAVDGGACHEEIAALGHLAVGAGEVQCLREFVAGNLFCVSVEEYFAVVHFHRIENFAEVHAVSLTFSYTAHGRPYYVHRLFVQGRGIEVAGIRCRFAWVENQLLLDAGWGWGYSCLTMIDKETGGILYESSVAHMTFQAVKLKDIIKTK